MTEQEINNLIDSKIGKTKMSQLPEATQTSGLYSIGYTGNQSVKYKANLLQGDPLTVRKTYQTEAEALADKNPIDTTTSLPLKIGQFVSIADDGEKNGIYRISSISGDGTMSLELQGKLGDLSDYANHGYESNPKTLKQVDDDLVQLSNEKVDEIFKTVYPNVIIADPNGNILSISDENGTKSKQEAEKINMIAQVNSKTADFNASNQNIYLIIDGNGYVAFAVDFYGNVHTKESQEIKLIESSNKERDVRIDSELLLNAQVISDLTYKHAFSPYLVFGVEGMAWICYGASIHLDEADRTDNYTIELVKTNAIDFSVESRHEIATQSEPFKAGNVVCSYNNQLYKFGNDIYVVFSVMPEDAECPQFAMKVVNSSTMEIGAIQALRLLYDSIDVEFTVNNYLKMIYDKGYVATLDVAPPTQNTIDNPNIYEKNGVYYWVMSMGNSINRPFVMLTSTDMVNWIFLKKLNISDRGGEISTLERDNVLYISYRTSEKIGYYIYDNLTDTVIESGTFTSAILSKPKTFSYNGRIFFAINAKSEYYTSEYYPILGDITNRVQVNIYEVVDNSIVEFSKMTNPYGCHYFDIVPHGTDIGKQSLYMVFSEDRRLLFPQRQFSNVSIKNITSTFIQKLK